MITDKFEILIVIHNLSVIIYFLILMNA